MHLLPRPKTPILITRRRRCWGWDSVKKLRILRKISIDLTTFFVEAEDKGIGQIKGVQLFESFVLIRINQRAPTLADRTTSDYRSRIWDSPKYFEKKIIAQDQSLIRDQRFWFCYTNSSLFLEWWSRTDGRTQGLGQHRSILIILLFIFLLNQ